MAIQNNVKDVTSIFIKSDKSKIKEVEFENLDPLLIYIKRSIY